MRLIELPAAMKEPYSLTAVYLKQVLSQLEISSTTRDLLLQKSMIDADRLNNDRLYRVPFYKLTCFLNLLGETHCSPTAHINAVFALRIKSFPLIGYAVSSSPTLRVALKRLIRLEPVVWDVGHISQKGDIDCTLLIWSAHTDIPPKAIEMAIAGWVSIGRQLFPTEKHPEYVSFMHDCPVHCDRYRRLFSCPVLFNAASNSIKFPSSWLDEHLIDEDEALATMMITQADALIENEALSLNLENVLRAKLFQFLPNELPDLSEISSQQGISARKMRALLNSKNLSYRQIVDDVRKEVAQHLLLQSTCSMADVAGFCGFLEQSSFNRAFKRWFDCAPSDYITHAVRQREINIVK